MVFSSFKSNHVPRGSLRDRPSIEPSQQLVVDAFGMVEKGISVTGFTITDMGANRQIAVHAQVLNVAQSVEQTTIIAATEAMEWLVAEKMHKKQVILRMSNMNAYILISGNTANAGEDTWKVLRQFQANASMFPYLDLRLVSPSEVEGTRQQTEKIYVAHQEGKRWQRAKSTLSELEQVSDTKFAVGERYIVDLETIHCTCPDFQHTYTKRFPIRCKHILAAMIIKQGNTDDESQ
ncbi:MAG: SWIM zinc finger family protein [Chloroflexota bacterium]